MSHWDFRLEVGLCKLVLAVFETVAFVAAEDSKLHDLEAGKINANCVCWRHLSVVDVTDACLLESFILACAQ